MQQFVRGVVTVVTAAASSALLPWWGFLAVALLAIVVIGGPQMISALWPTESADRRALLERMEGHYHDRCRRRADQRERRRVDREARRSQRSRSLPPGGAAP
jgi:hypothetical protein